MGAIVALPGEAHEDFGRVLGATLGPADLVTRTLVCRVPGGVQHEADGLRHQGLGRAEDLPAGDSFGKTFPINHLTCLAGPSKGRTPKFASRGFMSNVLL